MKGRRFAWAIMLLGLGALIGLGIGRGLSAFTVVRRVAQPPTGRVIIDRDLGGRLGRSVEIEIPPIPTVPGMPDEPAVPAESLTQRRIIISRDLPFGSVFRFIRTMLNLTANLLALLLILVGVVLIVRRRNAPLEKDPPQTAA